MLQTRVAITFAFLLFHLFQLTGCALNFGPSVGNQQLTEYDQQSLEKEFKYGVATQKDVLLKFGPPTRSNTTNSHVVWTYSQEKMNSVGVLFVNIQTGSRRISTFYFNVKNELLEKIEYKTESR